MKLAIRHSFHFGLALLLISWWNNFAQAQQTSAATNKTNFQQEIVALPSDLMDFRRCIIRMGVFDLDNSGSLNQTEYWKWISYLTTNTLEYPDCLPELEESSNLQDYLVGIERLYTELFIELACTCKDHEETLLGQLTCCDERDSSENVIYRPGQQYERDDYWITICDLIWLNVQDVCEPAPPPTDVPTAFIIAAPTPPKTNKTNFLQDIVQLPDKLMSLRQCTVRMDVFDLDDSGSLNQTEYWKWISELITDTIEYPDCLSELEENAYFQADSSGIEKLYDDLFIELACTCNEQEEVLLEQSPCCDETHAENNVMYLTGQKYRGSDYLKNICNLISLSVQEVCEAASPTAVPTAFIIGAPTPTSVEETNNRPTVNFESGDDDENQAGSDESATQTPETPKASYSPKDQNQLENDDPNSVLLEVMLPMICGLAVMLFVIFLLFRCRLRWVRQQNEIARRRKSGRIVQVQTSTSEESHARMQTRGTQTSEMDLLDAQWVGMEEDSPVKKGFSLHVHQHRACDEEECTDLTHITDEDTISAPAMSLARGAVRGKYVRVEGQEVEGTKSFDREKKSQADMDVTEISSSQEDDSSNRSSSSSIQNDCKISDQQLINDIETAMDEADLDVVANDEADSNSSPQDLAMQSSGDSTSYVPQSDSPHHLSLCSGDQQTMGQNEGQHRQVQVLPNPTLVQSKSIRNKNEGEISKSDLNEKITAEESKRFPNPPLQVLEFSDTPQRNQSLLQPRPARNEIFEHRWNSNAVTDGTDTRKANKQVASNDEPLRGKGRLHSVNRA